MKYWLCVTNEENWEVVKERGVWGVPNRNRRSIERVKPEDLLVFYVMPKKISGIFKVFTPHPSASPLKFLQSTEWSKKEVAKEGRNG